MALIWFAIWLLLIVLPEPGLIYLALQQILHGCLHVSKVIFMTIIQDVLISGGNSGKLANACICLLSATLYCFPPTAVEMTIIISTSTSKLNGSISVADQVLGKLCAYA